MDLHILELHCFNYAKTIHTVFGNFSTKMEVIILPSEVIGDFYSLISKMNIKIFFKIWSRIQVLLDSKRGKKLRPIPFPNQSE